MLPKPFCSAVRAVLLAGALAFGPADSAAQEGCEAVPPGNDIVRALTVGGLQITYITRPHFLCAGGVEIFADSAEAFPDRGMSHLIGNVRYLESARTMTADDARYFTNEGRLQASGSLRIVDEGQGSSITNGDLVYLLQTDFRDVAEMTVTTGADGIRPVAVLTPPPPAPDTASTDAMDEAPDAGEPADTSALVGAANDSTAAAEEATRPTAAQVDVPEAATDPDVPRDPPTYTVVGDRIFLLGDGYFTASGTVEIRQDSLEAFADSAEYDAEGSGLVLTGDARVVSSTYDLVGRSITMSSPGGPRSLVHALREARLQGDDLLLTSAQIFLFLQDDQLERLVATPIVGPAAINADSVDHERPRADVQDFVLTADSLEVRAPDQTIDRVFASGSARSESEAGDSLNVELLPEIARKDWLEGDTVIVTFAPEGPPPSADPSSAPENRRLEVDAIRAIGRARSLYRLTPSDSTSRAGVDPPAVHYVVGTEIRILMEDRQVQGMEVEGQTRGVHLEPLARRTVPDSTTVPDTTFVIDTARAVPDTSSVGLARGDRTEPRLTHRVREESPSTPEPEDRPSRRAAMENLPWNRPWMR